MLVELRLKIGLLLLERHLHGLSVGHALYRLRQLRWYVPGKVDRDGLLFGKREK